MTWLGIDPGLSGAIAVLRPDGVLAVHDVPTLKAGTGGKRVVDAVRLGHILEAILRDGRPEMALMERVASSPQMGVASAFAFGHCNGVLTGALGALMIPLQLVTPSAWKRALGIPAGSDKDRSRHRASELYPREAHLWARKKDDGRAEAALIATHARAVWRTQQAVAA